MENLEKIIAKIVDEANEKAKLILDDANVNSDKILNEIKKDIEIEKKALEKEYELIEKSELDRIKSSTALKTRNIILQAKQDTITYVLEELNKKILELSNETIKEYINNILSKRTLLENEKLILPKRYENIDLNMPYEISDKIDTGFLIEKNGIFENYSLEALLNLKKDEIEIKIQEVMFS